MARNIYKKISELPVGAKVKDSGTMYNDTPIIWKIADKNYSKYPENTVTLITDKIISLKAFDGKEGKNSQYLRTVRGNNYYKHSNILQWLNSSSYNWYIPKHGADAPPSRDNVEYNPYDKEAGFLYNFSEELKNALIPTSVRVARNSYDGGGNESVRSKIFLASATEVGLKNEQYSPNWAEDADAFKIFTNNKSRQAYPTREAVLNSGYKGSNLDVMNPLRWILRTPVDGEADRVTAVKEDGSLTLSDANDGTRGVRPLCNLSSDTLVHETASSDGAYAIKWTTPPEISGSDYDLGSKTSNFDIEYYVTDKEDNSISVEILLDDIQEETKKVFNNQKNIYTVNLQKLKLGKHTVIIKATNDFGVSSIRTYTFYKSNSAPIISGHDEDLGGKSLGFTITYDISDSDGDEIDVTISLNNEELSNISTTSKNGLSFTLDDEKVKKLTIGDIYTITIKADDRKGGIAYRRYTFTKINSVPVISGNNKDLGNKSEAFSQTFSVTDYEKDPISFRVKLDEKVIKEVEEASDGEEYTAEISHDDFIRLGYGKHKITIEAWDSVNTDDIQVREFTFTRVSSGLDVEIKVATSKVQPKKIIAVPHGLFASDANLQVLVTNNYLDESPTWEDATEMSNIARAYTFENSTKEGDEWAIGIKIVVENGESGEKSILKGVKGGFE